jgi:hypothetical protein
MNDTCVVTACSVIEDLMRACGNRDDPRASVSASEGLIVAAKHFQGHHERAICIPVQIIRYSVAECVNRRLHALRDWVYRILTVLDETLATGETFIIDSMPLPLCKRVRARRCQKVRGKAYCGYGATKREKFFGWHLLCTPDTILVAFDLLPASAHGLAPIHELIVRLPAGITVFDDKDHISKSIAQVHAERST